MNVFILTDMEGIAGVDDISQMDRSSAEYSNTRHLLCNSLNIAIDTCISNGAGNVYYLDGHGGGGNVFEELIDSRAVKCSISDWQQLLADGKIDCQIELGSHARAGTIGGFLDHTLSSREIFSIKINGAEMSELALHAILCAAYGVPVVVVSGDETVCRQSAEYIPGIYTAAVKSANCRNRAATYSNADAILSGTIADALSNYKSVALVEYAEPATVEICYYRSDMCEKALADSDGEARRVDARTLRKTVEKIRRYKDLRF